MNAPRGEGRFGRINWDSAGLADFLEVSDPAANAYDSYFATVHQLGEFLAFNNPRFRVIKSVLPQAFVLDLGAGTGPTFAWANWLPPQRNDLHLYANDINRTSDFQGYEDVFIGDLLHGLPEGWPGKFHLIIACHLLEHLKDWPKFFYTVLQLLRPGGTLYLELPLPRSKAFPSRTYFLEKGIPVHCVNFFDDDTHLFTAPLEQISKQLDQGGFAIQESGELKNRFLAQEALLWGRRIQNEDLCTKGLWYYFGFAQYIIAENRQDKINFPHALVRGDLEC